MTTIPYTSTFARFVLKALTLWLLLAFFPLWILLSRFTLGQSFLDKMIKYTQLNTAYLSLKDKLSSVKNWLVGIARALLHRTARSKYPFGYAILKKNGMYITSTHQFPYVIQLYDYLARKFMYLKNLSTFRVMEIEPTAEGGLEYLATALKATSCLGVTTDEYLSRSLKKSNINPRVKYIHSSKFDSPEIKEKNFDCIIGINVFERSKIVDQTLRLIKKSLKPTGYACLAEYLPVEQISVFQYCLKEAGLRVVKTENISTGLSNAIKIQSNGESEDTLWKKMRRVVDYVLEQRNLQIQVLAQLQMRRRFVAYIIESEGQRD